MATLMNRDRLRNLIRTTICFAQGLNASDAIMLARGEKWCAIAIDGKILTFKWNSLEINPEGDGIFMEGIQPDDTPLDDFPIILGLR